MIRALEIETSSFCNWKCNYCPVATQPKAPKIMDLALFDELLSKAAAHKTIKIISINSYNEPTINPHFLDYCSHIKSYGFKLLLHTNGSALTQDKIDRLKELDVVQQITFNMPTLNPAEFAATTKSISHAKSLAAIDAAIAAGFDIHININGTNEDLRRNVPSLRAKYPAQTQHPLYLLKEPITGTSDKLGMLPAYSRGVNITTPRLTGCTIPVEWLYVSVEGDFFLCCEDYHQRTKYGNIRDFVTIEELCMSPKAQQLLGWVNGVEDAPADFVCRKCMYMELQRGR